MSIKTPEPSEDKQYIDTRFHGKDTSDITQQKKVKEEEIKEREREKEATES